MEFIKNHESFRELRVKHSLFFNEEKFENNPFKERFKYYVAFEFDFIFWVAFLEGLIVFTKKTGSDKLFFYTTKPSVDYFFNRFNKYSAFEVDVSTPIKAENLYDFLDEPYDDSSIASIWLITNEVCWFSESNDWALLASRDWEIGIVAFSDLNLIKEFMDSFEEDAEAMIFPSLESHIKMLDKVFDFSKEAKSRYKKLIQNYQ